jgi:hypothetical protein
MTACGKLVRPVQHFYPLEVCSSSAMLSNSKKKTTNPSVPALDTHVPDIPAPGAECATSSRRAVNVYIQFRQ